MKRERIIMILYIMVFLLAVYVKFLYSPLKPIYRPEILLSIGTTYTEKLIIPSRVNKATFRVNIGKQVIGNFDINKKNFSNLRLTLDHNQKLYGMRFRKRGKNGISIIAKQDLPDMEISLNINNEPVPIYLDGKKKGEEIFYFSLTDNGRGTIESTYNELKLWNTVDYGDDNIIEYRKKNEDDSESFPEKLTFYLADEEVIEEVISADSRIESDENLIEILYRERQPTPPGDEDNQQTQSEGIVINEFYTDIERMDIEEPNYFEPALIKIGGIIEFDIITPRDGREDELYIGIPYKTDISTNVVIDDDVGLTLYLFDNNQMHELNRGSDYTLTEVDGDDKTNELKIINDDIFRRGNNNFIIKGIYRGVQEDSNSWIVRAEYLGFAVDIPVMPAKMEEEEEDLFNQYSQPGHDIVYENRNIIVLPTIIGANNPYIVQFDNNTAVFIDENSEEIGYSVTYNPQERRTLRAKVRPGSGGRDIVLSSPLLPEKMAFRARVKRVPDLFEPNILIPSPGIPIPATSNADNFSTDIVVLDYFNERISTRCFSVEINRPQRFGKDLSISDQQDSFLIQISNLRDYRNIVATVRARQSPHHPNEGIRLIIGNTISTEAANSVELQRIIIKE